MKKNIFSLLLATAILLILPGCSATIQNDLAKTQIVQLHDNGALVVRLKTSTKKIEQLNRLGYTKTAKYVQEQLDANNKELIEAFKENFDFCPVYFMPADHSVKFLERKYNGIFVNEKLETDSSIKLPESGYILTAEMGATKQDTSKYSSGSYYTTSGEGDIEKRKEYYGGANLHIEGLIMKSDHFIQLQSPFPYYVREHIVIIKKSKSDIVQQMNKKLWKFYYSIE